MSDTRFDVQEEITDFLTKLTNSLVEKEDEADSEADSEAISRIAEQIGNCGDKLKCFLDNFSDIDDILEKYIPTKRKRRMNRKI